jgi:hypothetical protein
MVIQSPTHTSPSSLPLIPQNEPWNPLVLLPSQGNTGPPALETTTTTLQLQHPILATMVADF